jgi:amino acid transporter
VLICVSCAGAISGMMYAASRMYFALGRHHATFGWLGQWNHRTHSPLRAQLLQGAVVMGMLTWSWTVSQDPFTNLVVIGAPFFWTFLSLSGLSLIRLRYAAADQERTFRVPFYPATPLIFAGACLFMLYSSAAYLWRTSLFVRDDQGNWQGLNGAAYWALAILISGLLLARTSRTPKT